MLDQKYNPFTPGAGGTPPYLAGRARQQERYRKNIQTLRAGRIQPGDIMMYGPRGNGKTVLLEWLRKEVDRDRKLTAVEFEVTGLTLDNLARRLAPAGALRRLVPEKIRHFGVEWSPDAGVTLDNLVPRLVAQCQESPMVVLVDEAHTLDPTAARALVQISQQVRKRDAPFLLVLTGTPGLPTFMTGVDATFANRCDRIGVGLLSEAAAMAAIAEPLSADGIRIDKDTLTRAAHDTQGYPYFVQLWGRALWDRAEATGRPRLDRTDFAAAKSEVDSVRTDYYADRYSEIRREALTPLVVAVASAFRGAPLERHEIDRCVRGALNNGGVHVQESGAEQMLEALTAHGVVWRQPGERTYRPGVPSLLDFVAAEAAPLANP